MSANSEERYATAGEMAEALEALDRATRRTRTLIRSIPLFLLIVAGLIAWLAWPARAAAPATIRVDAIQGNIPQNVKWTAQAFDTAIARYTLLTRKAAQRHPAIVLWPETVMTVDLNLEPSLSARIGALAREAHATLIVGAKQQMPAAEYNALYVYRPDGGLDTVYRKQRLVPFVL